MKISYIIMGILVAVSLIGCTNQEEPIGIDEPDLLMAGPVVVDAESTDEDMPNTVKVFVCGAVNNPGVYELESGARVCDALALAGDFAEDADTEYLNQAAGLTDGERLYVPKEDETDLEYTGFSEDANTQDGSIDSSGLVNINTASESELRTLPGIGEVKAGAIIAYREEHGNFTSIEQIKQVDGIKSGLYDSIKDKIKVQ